jgi:hypothetical protein
MTQPKNEVIEKNKSPHIAGLLPLNLGLLARVGGFIE